MWKKLFSKSPKKSSDPVQDPPGCVSGRSIDDLVARTRVHDGFWSPVVSSVDKLLWKSEPCKADIGQWVSYWQEGLLLGQQFIDSSKIEQ